MCSVISGFRRGVREVFALLKVTAAQIGSLLPTFRDNISFQSSRAKQSGRKEPSIYVDRIGYLRYLCSYFLFLI
jgi:hypothetical protein